MKKVLFHSVFMITCAYFLTAANISFFSKLGKNVQTELCHLDEDANDSEGKDSKEDGCDEDVFVDLLNTALLPQSHEVSDLTFCDLHLFLPKNIVEITSPPPKA